MKNHLKSAVLLFAMLAFLTGFLYPLAVTGVAQLLFPYQANGSLIRDERGQLIGSELIGQPFTGERYFLPRPSTTAEFPYNPMASGGSQYAATNKKLVQAVEANIKALQAVHGAEQVIPADLVFASGSGLDPHISLEAALYQVPRVAKARNLDKAELCAVVLREAEGRTFGLLGQPRVNVLKLNLLLDK